MIDSDAQNDQYFYSNRMIEIEAGGCTPCMHIQIKEEMVAYTRHVRLRKCNIDDQEKHVGK